MVLYFNSVLAMRLSRITTAAVWALLTVGTALFSPEDMRALRHGAMLDEGAGLAGIAPGAIERAFTLLTYNVAGLPQGISASRPLRNMPRIGRKLRDFDLVLLQEDFVYHHLLALRAGHPYRSAPRRKSLRFGDGLSRFSMLPFEEPLHETWTACSGVVGHRHDCLADKGFSLAVHELAPGVPLFVYNVHLDSGRHEQDIAARAAQVEQLLADIRARPASVPVIVAGDTNLDRSAADQRVLARLLTGGGLVDACSAARCGTERIDRVLFRSGASVRLKVRAWEIAPGFTDSKGRPLSDHPPVTVRFAWEHGAAPDGV